MSEEKSLNNRIFKFVADNRAIFLFISPIIIIVIVICLINLNSTQSISDLIMFGSQKEPIVKYKSDAELIANFQAHREEFNQIPQQLLQLEKENVLLLAEKAKNDEIMEKKRLRVIEHIKELTEKELNRLVLEKNINADILENQKKKVIAFSENVREKEFERLYFERSKFEELLFQNRNKKLKEIDTAIKGLGNPGYSFEKIQANGEKNLRIYGFGNSYSESHFWENTTEEFTTGTGYFLFGENNQPDKQFVVENFDDLHTSTNLKTTIKNLKSKFGQDRGEIYVHIEGNWYLYFCFSRGVMQNKVDGD